MDVIEAVLTRRSIKEFRPERVPPAVLDRALAAGLWAQNHHLTQPWRFVILGPQVHGALAELSAEGQIIAIPPSDGAMREKVREGALRKILSKPQIVSVSYRLSDDPQQRREDYAATCCAIQIIQLAAWSDGLGMQWTTNRTTRDPRTYTLLEINPALEEIVGFLYFGYPANAPTPQPRKSLAEVSRRLP